MSISFVPRAAGFMTGRTSKTGDRIEIKREGKEWVLTVKEELTGVDLHTFRAARQYLCCQEACRYFHEGAYADPNASVFVRAP